MIFVKWYRRWKCHGDTVCCQHIDLPTCNTQNETHWRGRRWFWKINHADAS